MAISLLQEFEDIIPNLVTDSRGTKYLIDLVRRVVIPNQPAYRSKDKVVSIASSGVDE